ncbi:MAG TPA: UDP-3-O-acyl-N-acetylglucosamine deacetylase, partial [Candidatus Xenobia bacterium]
RTDLPQRPEGRVEPAAARESSRCMQLQWGEVQVLTPEHLLSACHGLGIRDARFLLDGPEVPILDGSAAPFARAMVESGLTEGAPQEPLHLDTPVAVVDGSSMILCRPAPTFSATYVAHYPHPLVGTQVYEYGSDTDYLSQIAPARTFGFLEEVEALRAQGLIMGGSLECAVVVMPDHFSTPLRFPDELVRHKVLDLLGDLAVLGRPLAAHVIAVRTSHRLHVRLLHALAERMTLCGRPA